LPRGSLAAASNNSTTSEELCVPAIYSSPAKVLQSYLGTQPHPGQVYFGAVITRDDDFHGRPAASCDMRASGLPDLTLTEAGFGAAVAAPQTRVSQGGRGSLVSTPACYGLGNRHRRAHEQRRCGSRYVSGSERPCRRRNEEFSSVHRLLVPICCGALLDLAYS
jgi:hypothetical protein